MPIVEVEDEITKPPVAFRAEPVPVAGSATHSTVDSRGGSKDSASVRLQAQKVESVDKVERVQVRVVEQRAETEKPSVEKDVIAGVTTA